MIWFWSGPKKTDKSQISKMEFTCECSSRPFSVSVPLFDKLAFFEVYIIYSSILIEIPFFTSPLFPFFTGPAFNKKGFAGHYYLKDNT